ncbi:hypothetical protein [Methylocystis echinoides]|uniref:Uncharacterized protein n=1 Tax=Methylocystis echinoides TaxID=29468 RepID=A0A9W6GXT9_9HYPH|nr:hypothetical protein [Methylocystis echinoides]GLI94906.1 hypothetical protein LMG27198_38980 [Methylocystis echinoides]
MVAFLNSRITERTATRGAARLAQLLKPDGLFVYQHLAGGSRELSADYELHRHFCAGWALLRVADKLSCGSEVRLAGEASVRAGLQAFVVPFGADGCLCLAHDGKIEISVCGLALFAAGLLQITPDDGDIVSTASAVGNYIVSQQMADGDFIHIRDFASGERLPLVSEYSAAQALLGLFSLSKITGEPRWSRVAQESLLKLASRKNAPLPRNHWVLYALEQALLASDDPRWLEAAQEILLDMLKDPVPAQGITACWLACNCEAILTWIRMVATSDRSGTHARLYERAYSRLKLLLRKLVAFQLDDGGFTNEIGHKLVQIDFIHHSIIAFAEFSNLPPRKF